ncbi:Tyrosyl-DNA phosphodiesterase 1 [Galdieria sulphuraria]|nr:Tyrosyl-DNA phosphodiesterase 1 [Galdieria sulphuraria]
MSQKDLVDSLGFYLNQVEGAISIFTKSLDEIFQPGFHSVLLTNYMFDLSWLFQRVPILLTVERLLIVHGDEQVYQPFSPYHFITFHKPRLPFPYGTHHTKLIILFYPTKVRFVLTTANMIQSDWEYKTQETMDDYLSALAGVVLIPSVPGYHGGRNLDKYGHRSLHSNISQYCCISDEQRIRRKTTHSTIRLLLQCSSMGSISEKWLKQELFHSMCTTSKEFHSRLCIWCCFSMDQKELSVFSKFSFVFMECLLL